MQSSPSGELVSWDLSRDRCVTRPPLSSSCCSAFQLSDALSACPTRQTTIIQGQGPTDYPSPEFSQTLYRVGIQGMWMEGGRDDG